MVRVVVGEEDGGDGEVRGEEGGEEGAPGGEALGGVDEDAGAAGADEVGVCSWGAVSGGGGERAGRGGVLTGWGGWDGHEVEGKGWEGGRVGTLERELSPTISTVTVKQEDRRLRNLSWIASENPRHQRGELLDVFEGWEVGRHACEELFWGVFSSRKCWSMKVCDLDCKRMDIIVAEASSYMLWQGCFDRLGTGKGTEGVA